MYERFVERLAEQALTDTPVVLIVGPRRAGKATLVRKMGETARTYITLHDQTVFGAANQIQLASSVAWIGPSSTTMRPAQ